MTRAIPFPVATQPATTPAGASRRPSAAWWCADRGSVSAELAVLAPVLIMLLVVVGVVVHRTVDTRLRLDDTAHQAARAATLERSAGAARAAADSTARDALTTAGSWCAELTVRTDTTRMVPGGLVTVTLSCTVDLTGAAIPGIGPRTLTATASDPVDTWRSTYTGTGP